jgi:S-methylmethionine-dependent homocysteine/selenocysteine methylase
MILLDGPIGTMLEERGIALPSPAWTGHAVSKHPGMIRAIHSDYAEAGATLHTAATFRTRRRDIGDEWQRMTRRAVRIAREAIPSGQRVAGSISPLEDCYRPDLSPPNSRAEHVEFARFLATCGVDIMLCETFTNPPEALVAVSAAVSTGVETWLSLSAGPAATLMTSPQVFATARHAVRLGASCVLINCTDAAKTLDYLQPLATLGVPFGAYANAGPRELWNAETSVPLYVIHARTWVALGATVIGCCCGTGPQHVKSLRHTFIDPLIPSFSR